MGSVLVYAGFDPNVLRKLTILNSQETMHEDAVVDNVDLQLQHFIGRIVQRDQSAFSSLFKIMSSRVYSVALRITGNVQLAEEVAEDTFFQVWRQAPRFDPFRGSVIAWILTIARSRALDARRRNPPFDELTDNEQDSDLEHAGHCAIPDLLSVTEQNQALYVALESLDELPRQLLALSYFKGFSHEEIAHYTDLPLGTVKSHLRRSILLLREKLAKTN